MIFTTFDCRTIYFFTVSLHFFLLTGWFWCCCCSFAEFVLQIIFIATIKRSAQKIRCRAFHCKLSAEQLPTIYFIECLSWKHPAKGLKVNCNFPSFYSLWPIISNELLFYIWRKISFFLLEFHIKFEWKLIIICRLIYRSRISVQCFMAPTNSINSDFIRNNLFLCIFNISMIKCFSESQIQSILSSDCRKLKCFKPGKLAIKWKSTHFDSIILWDLKQHESFENSTVS